MRYVVFTSRRPGADVDRLLGLTDIAALRLRFSWEWPWLEAALWSAWEAIRPAGTGRLDDNTAEQLWNKYVSKLRTPPPSPPSPPSPPPPAPGWVKLGDGDYEHAQWLDDRILAQVLDSDLHRGRVPARLSPRARAARIRAAAGDVVPIVDAEDRLVQLTPILAQRV